jgi:hypothetical protein
VDTEHLVLALFQLDGCVACRVLARGRVLLETTQRELPLVNRAKLWAVSPRRLRMTPELRKAVDLALAAAERLGHPRVGTGHLLLGLLEEDGVACRALRMAGIVRLGENLSAVARHACEEMDGVREKQRRDEEERVVVPQAFPKHSPKADHPASETPKVEGPLPANPAAPRRVEDAVITFLSVALMVVAAVNLLPAGSDVSDVSHFIDVALFLLGTAGVQMARAVKA